MSDAAIEKSTLNSDAGKQAGAVKTVVSRCFGIDWPRVVWKPARRNLFEGVSCSREVCPEEKTFPVKREKAKE